MIRRGFILTASITIDVYKRQGYKRNDGKTGVRNEIWILPTVGCVNSVAKLIEAEAKKRFPLGAVEDIIAFNHPYGCSQMGDDQENTRKVFADMIHHPNAAGVLVLGLGCENCNIPVLMDYIGDYDKDRVKFMQCQDFEDETEKALEPVSYTHLGILFGPFLFEDWDDCWTLIESDWYKGQEALLEEKGLKLLGSNWIYGDRHTLTVNPVNTVEDLAGMKTVSYTHLDVYKRQVIWLKKERAKKLLPANWNILADQEIIATLTKKLGEENVKLVEKNIEKMRRMN